MQLGVLDKSEVTVYQMLITALVKTKKETSALMCVQFDTLILT